MTLELVVHRQSLVKEKCTLGKVTWWREDSTKKTFLSYCLEDPVRDLGPDGKGKIYGRTAIPAGRYRVTIEKSPKFGRDFIRIHDVPYFTGILWHSGLDEEDTLGCLLVGDHLQDNAIVPGTTRPALKRIFDLVQAALKAGEPVFATYLNEFSNAPD